MDVYHGEWEKQDDVFDSFMPRRDRVHSSRSFQNIVTYYAEEFEDVEILLAAYTDENYEGNAVVLFRKGGTLYEVHGSHCSCNGLEGQWSPEATTLESIKARIDAAVELGKQWDDTISANDAALLARVNELLEEARV